MKTRCLPGDRCLVIGDVRGCDCNIGARLTVTERVPSADVSMPPAWFFKHADRALKCVDHDAAGRVIPNSDSWTTGIEPADAPISERPVFFDHHLVPLRDIAPGVLEAEALGALG